MPAVKEKKKSRKGIKILKVIIAVILAIAVAATAFIEIVTRPVDDQSENAVAVGGMLKSDTIDYQCESAQGLEKNPIIKIMQMVWRFCYDGDMKKHADQTPPTVDEYKDIAYIDDGNRYHTLDVYTPQGNTEKLPVIIDIHGGGWMYAEKSLNEYYCKALCDRGYTVFNISYRLVPDVTVNEQIQDVCEALKWISEHLGDYPCDPDSIMLTGDSAGGMLAVYSAVLAQSEELRDVFDVVDPSIQIDALVLTSPVAYMKDGALGIYTKVLWGTDYKDKATYDYMNLDEIIDYADLPPTYLITSDGDTLAHGQTLKAYDLLTEKGVTAELADFSNGDYDEDVKLPHVFSVLYPFDIAGQDAIGGATEFFNNAIAAQAN